jgi:hypothetical protein
MITKDTLISAMRSAAEAYYTRRPSSAMASLPLKELAEAVLAKIGGVEPDKLVQTVQEYDPELTPKLRWNSPAVQLGDICYGVGVKRGGDEANPRVVLMPYEGDYTHPDGEISLIPVDAQSFALAVLSAAQDQQPSEKD